MQYFEYSLGVFPVKFFEILLNGDFELKPNHPIDDSVFAFHNWGL